MNMLMIVCPEERQEEVRTLITGKHFGTHTWPGTSVLIFTVVDAAKKAELVKALKAYHDGLYETEGLRVFALPVESEF